MIDAWLDACLAALAALHPEAAWLGERDAMRDAYQFVVRYPVYRAFRKRGGPVIRVLETRREKCAMLIAGGDPPAFVAANLSAAFVSFRVTAQRPPNWCVALAGRRERGERGAGR